MSTCNSAMTYNASLARYRKRRHSRPLVTTTLKRRSIFSSMCAVGALCSTTIEPSRGLLSLTPVSSFVARCLALKLRGTGMVRALLAFCFFFPTFRPASLRGSRNPPPPLCSFSLSLVRDFKAATAFAIRSSVYGRHCETKAALCLLRAFRFQLTRPRSISIPSSLFIVCSFDIRLPLDCGARGIYCIAEKLKIKLFQRRTVWKQYVPSPPSFSRRDELISDVTSGDARVAHRRDSEIRCHSSVNVA